MRIEVDLLFTDVLEGLWALHEYRERVEEQIEYLGAQEPMKIRQALEEGGHVWEDAEVQLGLQEVRELTEQVYPRLFRYSYLAMLWAHVETSTLAIADRVARYKSQELRIDDIRGGFLNRVRLYFKKVIHTPLPQRPWESLVILQVVRNAIVHGNGTERAMSKDNLSRLQQWAQVGKGPAFTDGRLDPSPGFLATSLDAVDEFLGELMESARREIQRARGS